MTGFIGRRKELEGLESLHSGPGLKTCALYGRRDVGKTALLTEFCRGKDALYFHLRKRSEIENAAYMMDVISEHLGEEPCLEAGCPRRSSQKHWTRSGSCAMSGA